jgi:hypothetical protein
MKSVQPFNSLRIQTGSVNFQFEIPYTHSLVDFLNQTGYLYYGHLHSKLFDDFFQKIKNNFLNNQLLNISSCNIDCVQPAMFNLHMIRTAQQQTWRWPALATELNEGLSISGGNSRILATAIIKENPSNQLNFLIFQPHNRAPDKFLSDPVQVVSDEHLHQLLNLPYSSGTTDPEIELSVELVQQHNHSLALKLRSIYDGNSEHHFYAGAELLANFHGWLQCYGPKPQLDVYTNWPELIYDSTNFWNISHVGPSQLSKNEHFRLGTLELFARHNAPEINVDNQHALFVNAPRRFDIGEILCWMDLHHNCWIDRDLDFMLYRSNHEYVTRFIDLSQ